MSDEPSLEELDAQFTGAVSTHQAAVDRAAHMPGGAEFTPFCPTLEVWVVQVFAAIYVRRPTATFRWCAQWWRHPEALTRLEALWRTWEDLRLEPMLGIAVWHRDHLDHHLPILTGPAGPFADCDPTEHFDPPLLVLPTVPAPADWWPPTVPPS